MTADAATTQAPSTGPKRPVTCRPRALFSAASKSNLLCGSNTASSLLSSGRAGPVLAEPLPLIATRLPPSAATDAGLPCLPSASEMPVRLDWGRSLLAVSPLPEERMPSWEPPRMGVVDRPEPLGQEQGLGQREPRAVADREDSVMDDLLDVGCVELLSPASSAREASSLVSSVGIGRLWSREVRASTEAAEHEAKMEETSPGRDCACSTGQQKPPTCKGRRFLRFRNVCCFRCDSKMPSDRGEPTSLLLPAVTRPCMARQERTY